jgi:hypothetical protein
MKNLITFTLSVCFFTLLNAQTFAPIGTKWGYNFATAGGGGSFYLESVGDTVIQGKTCRKLASKTVNVICPTCQWTTLGTRVFYEANDSLFAVYNTGFTFLFSYRLAIGDTLKLRNNQNYVLVRKVDTLISGQTLKKWQMRSICSDPRYGKLLSDFVEKIGDMNGYIGLNYYCFSDPEYIQLCSFSLNNIQINGFCQFTNTREVLSQNAVSLSPNPAFNSLKIETKHPFQQLKIYDSVGKMFQNGFYTEGGVLDISALPKGLFILQLTDNVGLVVNRKFIKQK